MAWLVSDARVLASAEVADTRRARRRGLLGRDGLDGALVIERCRWIHTVGMRFPIDVAYLDDDGIVVKTMHMNRFRLGVPVWRASWVIEAEGGALLSRESRGLVEERRRGTILPTLGGLVLRGQRTVHWQIVFAIIISFGLARGRRPAGRPKIIGSRQALGNPRAQLSEQSLIHSRRERLVPEHGSHDAKSVSDLH